MGIYDPEKSIFTHMCKEIKAVRDEQIREVCVTKGWTYSRAKRFVLKREARKIRSTYPVQ